LGRTASESALAVNTPLGYPLSSRERTLRWHAASILEAGAFSEKKEEALKMNEVMTKRLQDLGYL
jgi:hypothetical protein